MKPQGEKPSGSGSHGSKESGQKRQKGEGGKEKTVGEGGVKDKYSSDEDVWATEDEDNYGNESDSSQDECDGRRSVGLRISIVRNDQRTAC